MRLLLFLKSTLFMVEHHNTCITHIPSIKVHTKFSHIAPVCKNWVCNKLCEHVKQKPKALFSDPSPNSSNAFRMF